MIKATDNIKAIHIAPTKLIGVTNEKYNKGLNMVLTHLVLEDEEYREAMLKLPGIKYLDNSFFELGYCMTPEDMLKAAKLVKATHLICPDGTHDGLNLFKEAGYKVMCIPTTTKQFKSMMWDTKVDLVGLSEEHFAYRHSPGVRLEVLRDNIELLMPKKKIHLLGATDSIWELGMLYPFKEYIYSWDSSSAIVQGLRGHRTLKMQRKDTTSVDFGMDGSIENFDVVTNIQDIQKLLEGYQPEELFVPGTEGKYSVDSWGNIFSNWRMNNGGKVQTKRLIGSSAGSGNTLGDYQSVTLYVNDTVKVWASHRLVAAVFCDDWYDDCVVNHRDGNPANNYYLNLECGTNKHNIQHGHRTGLIPKQVTKLEVEFWEYLTFKFLYKSIAVGELARQYEVDRNSIHKYLAAIRQKGIFPKQKWLDKDWSEWATDGIYKEVK